MIMMMITMINESKFKLKQLSRQLFFFIFKKNTVLKTTSISFSYDNLNSFIFPEISLNDSEDLLILGKSGIGKTTFIQILAGLLKPDKGSISLNGVKYADLSLKKMDEFRGKNISLVFQKPYFIKVLI